MKQILCDACGMVCPPPRPFLQASLMVNGATIDFHPTLQVVADSRHGSVDLCFLCKVTVFKEAYVDELKACNL